MTTTLQVDRIRHLADVIEAQPHTELNDSTGFNMSDWTHNCGTPSCICGWANHLRNESEGRTVMLASPREAGRWLGFDDDDDRRYVLFKPSTIDPDNWNAITPAHAAAVLRHLADTGVVDWSVSP